MQSRTSAAVLALSWVAAVVPHISASPKPGDALEACAVEDPMVYIRSSLQRVEDGEELTTVLDTLVCIAANSKFPRPSVRALFHLAGDDKLIRKYLLEIVDSGSYFAGTAAGELLPLVADDEVRKELRQQAQARWKRSTNFSGQHLALTKLGDLTYGRWLEEHVLESELHERVRSHYEVEVAKIHAQHDTETILTQLASATPDFHRGWLLQHALRRGVAREELRAALLTYVRGLGEVRGRVSIPGGLPKTCRDNDLLPEAELAELERRCVWYSSGHEVDTVWWAVAADIRRRAFFSYGAANESSQREMKP